MFLDKEVLAAETVLDIPMEGNLTGVGTPANQSFTLVTITVTGVPMVVHCRAASPGDAVVGGLRTAAAKLGCLTHALIPVALFEGLHKEVSPENVS